MQGPVRNWKKLKTQSQLPWIYGVGGGKLIMMQTRTHTQTKGLRVQKRKQSHSVGGTESGSQTKN